jgi:hypothetical protein
MNPPHEPTDDQRKKVQRASGLGLPHEQISALVGISPPTLRKHYSLELGLGKAESSAAIADTLFNKAQAGDTTAMIWWTKAQMRWSETSTMQMANADGTKLEGINVVFVDPKPRA